MSGLNGTAPLRLHYDGSGGRLGRLTFRITLLTVLSLLIYRFWARTRVRRFLWSHVLLDGDRFEYTGTGGELFRGFLRVALIFAPIALVVAILDAFVLPGVNRAQLPLFLLLAVIGSYYARRYRLTRTSWRGIRGNLVGNAGAYLGLSLLHMLHTVLTLGLTYPIYRLVTARYLIAHSWFGDRQFSCAPRYFRLWLRYVPIWIVALLLALGIVATLYGAASAQARGDSQAARLLAESSAAATLLGSALVLWWMAMFSLYRLWEFRALLEATRFGGLTIKARPHARLLFASILATGFVMFFAALGLGLTAAGVAFLLSAMGQAIGGELSQAVGIVLAAAAGFLVVYPVFAAIKAMFWTSALAEELIGTIEISGETDFARLEQNRDYVPDSGEGLFDVFDFAG